MLYKTKIHAIVCTCVIMMQPGWALANNCSLLHNLECVTPITICWPALLGGREPYGQCLLKFDNGYCLPCEGFDDPRKCETDASDCHQFSASVKVPVALAAPTVGANLDGRLEIAVAGADGVLFHLWETDNGWARSAAPFPAGPHVSSPALVVQRGLGPLDVFAISSAGTVGHVQQLAPNVNWGTWEQLGGAGTVTALSGVMRTYEDLVLVGISSNGDYLISKDEAHKIWMSVGSGFQGLPAIGSNADGRLELFGVQGVSLVHKWEYSPGGNWSDWTLLGKNVSADPTAIQNEDGRIAIFVSTKAATLRLYEQDKPNSGWRPPMDFVGTHRGHPAVVRDRSGKLEVFVVGVDDGSVYRAEQSKAGGEFNKFRSIGGTLESSPAVGIRKNGSIDVFGIGQDGSVWYSNGADKRKWGAWERLGGSARTNAF